MTRVKRVSIIISIFIRARNKKKQGINKMDSTKSESINYQKRVFNHPSYRSSRQLPTNGSMAPILLANSQTSVSFDLPAQCYNLSRSKLVFSLLCTPTVRGVCLNACPTSLWDRVVLSTRGGLTLLDIKASQRVLRIRCDFEDFTN